MRGGGANQQNARLLIAQAALAQGDFQTAYEAAQRLRAKYPRGVHDAEARALAYDVLAQHPALEDAPTQVYHREEAALLIREGEFNTALEQVTSRSRLGRRRRNGQSFSGCALRRRAATKMRRVRRWRAISRSRRPVADTVAALNRLAHSYWRSDDTEEARRYFQRLAAIASGNEAAEARFELGRTYEDDDQLETARREYLAIVGGIRRAKPPNWRVFARPSCSMCRALTRRRRRDSRWRARR